MSKTAIATDDKPLVLSMIFEVQGGPEDGQLMADRTEIPKFYPLTGHFMQEAASWRVMRPVKILHMEYLC